LPQLAPFFSGVLFSLEEIAVVIHSGSASAIINVSATGEKLEFGDVSDQLITVILTQKVILRAIMVTTNTVYDNVCPVGPAFVLVCGILLLEYLFSQWGSKFRHRLTPF
jgi:hypothetical protein